MQQISVSDMYRSYLTSHDFDDFDDLGDDDDDDVPAATHGPPRTSSFTKPRPPSP
jgi:hypothetical protein